MSEIDDIPPDQMCTMTVLLDRAFRAVGCEPECHCCEKPILLGKKFKLAYINRIHQWPWKSTDEMLCYHCTPAKLLEQEKATRERAVRSARGFSRPHKVIK